MKKLSYTLLLIASVIMTGCATATQAYRVMDPHHIHRENLSTAKPFYSPKYKLPYAKTDGVDYSNKQWGEMIDVQYGEYSSCVKTKLKEDPQLKELQQVKIIIVKDSKFKCKYHGGRCSGEYDPSLQTIFVSRKDFDKKG
ncbi:MAG: hypothetical protein ACR2NW_07490, partial [Thermodesulfobacteriota bacterium]